MLQLRRLSIVSPVALFTISILVLWQVHAPPNESFLDKGNLSFQHLDSIWRNQQQQPTTPTFHILRPPKDIADFAYSCSSTCFPEAYQSRSPQYDALGKIREPYDQTMPYQLRATSQFALGELFRERVQALIERQPPSIQMDEADFIMLDTSAFSDLHQCVKCVTKTKNHPLILSHLKPDESLEDWVQLHRRLLQEHSQNMVKWLHDTINNLRGRRKYRSIFFVLSRIGAAYPTDLMAKGTMKLFGQDVVPVGIEPRYSGKRQEEPFIQVPYPTHFHLNSTNSLLALEDWQLSQERPQLLSFFVGRVQVLSKDGTALRRALAADLEHTPVEQRGLIHFSYEARQYNKMYQQMAKSIFCIQPTGDSPTRRGLYDSLLLGCIPVIFDEKAYQDFGWPSVNVNNLSLIIPYEDYMARGSPGLIERLNSIPLHTIEEKQRLIARAAPALQYSLLEDGYALQDDAFGRVIRQLQQQMEP